MFLVNTGEDIKSLSIHWSFTKVEEGIGFEVGLKDEQLGSFMVSMELTHVPDFMFEEAL